MDNLNNGFNAQSIIVVDAGFDEILSDYYADFDDTKFNQLMSVNSQSNALNIYILANNPSQYGGKGDGIPGHGLVIALDLALTNVVDHEVGHLLNLFHTHHGSIDAGVLEGGCQEKIDGSNCSTCGDFLCDTPADPDLAGVVDFSCNYVGTETQNGVPYHPNTHNFMSYSLPECLSEFSTEQGERMRSALANETILQSVKTQPEINTSTSTLCGSMVVTLANIPPGITPNWTATPSGLANVPLSGNPINVTRTANANGLLTITSSFNDACGIYSLSKTIVVGTPSISIDGPSAICPCTCCNMYSTIDIPGATYNWTVTPSSGNYVSGIDNQAELIVTSPCTLAVDITTPCGIISSSRRIFLQFPDQCSGGCSLPSYVISPNPAQNSITISTFSNQKSVKQDLKTSSDNLKIMDIKIVKIYNINGRLIKRQDFGGNLSQVQMDVSKLPNGIYLLEISDGEYNEEQRIIINR